MTIDIQRSWVKILCTSNLYWLICMENQLLNHPVFVRVLNVCVTMFPFSHHLPRKVSDGGVTIENPPVEMVPDFVH
jgi:hypothetical protein